jgi:DHA1 family multidrug resistance protein-like MFS transporter
MPENSKKPLINRQLAIFLAATFFIEAARSMTTVQVPVYLRELGADIRQIGLFFTLSLIFPLLLRIFGGWISDTIGRLRAMLIGSLAGVLTYIAYALSPSWEMALLAPAMLAVATALTIPSYYAHIADQTTEETRGRVFGFAETTRMLAWIFSPPLGGFLGENFGYRTMFTAAALAACMAALIILFLTRRGGLPSKPLESQPSLASLGSSLRQMAILSISGGLITWILITDGARDSALKISFDLMPVYLTDIAALTKGDIGLLDGIFGIAWVLTSFPAGWLVDKASERLAITIGIAVQLLSLAVFAIAGGFWGFAFSWILLGIGGAMLEPAYSSLIARGVPREVRGITYGLVATSLGLFTLPFPWAGGQIWAWLGPKAPFLLTVVLGSLSLIPAWTKLIPREGEGEDELAGATDNPK